MPSAMTGAFFPSDTELVLLNQDELLNPFFSTSCQPSSTPLYPTIQLDQAALQAPMQTPMHTPFQTPFQTPIPSPFLQSNTSSPAMPQGQLCSAMSTPAMPQQQFWTPPLSAEPEQITFQRSPRHNHSLSMSHIPDSSNGLGFSFPTRASRSPSFASVGTFPHAPSSDGSRSNISRSVSPSGADLRAYGYLNSQGTWSCAYPGCTSRAVFTRGCDLRKHHKRHTKSFFCHYPGCPQATGGGFSSKKDLARHEAKHNPGVVCEWKGCDRIFSRVDNMRDHVKRIHMKAAKTAALARAQAASS